MPKSHLPYPADFMRRMVEWRRFRTQAEVRMAVFDFPARPFFLIPD